MPTGPQQYRSGQVYPGPGPQPQPYPNSQYPNQQPPQVSSSQVM